jgi:Uncharacterized protein conserved in bacteria (DUF2252)
MAEAKPPDGLWKNVTPDASLLPGEQLPDDWAACWISAIFAAREGCRRSVDRRQTVGCPYPVSIDNLRGRSECRRPARMDIVKATHQFEQWMSQQTTLVRRDLRLKHQRMAESPFLFLRATLYRSMQLWPKICPDLSNALEVPAVGDLHLENFGTWRDIECRLVWGATILMKQRFCRTPSRASGNQRHVGDR